MIQSEGLTDELIANLHFHGYFKMESSNIFGNGPYHVVANKSKINHIQTYIDDLFIDYFFRNHVFKPIIIPKGIEVREYTKEGIIVHNNGLKLNLQSPYDRYTFVGFIMQIIFDYSQYLSKIFPNNSFFADMAIVPKKYGPIWESFDFSFNMPNGDAFYQYLNSLYGTMHSKFNPILRGMAFINYSESYHKSQFCESYSGLTPVGINMILKRHKDYDKIRNEKIFGDYTMEDILFIYSLLVEKLELKENNILSFIGLYVLDTIKDGSFLSDFCNFENTNCDAELLKPYIHNKDLFLRFTSATKSKAMKFKYISDVFAEIYYFCENPIRTIYLHNTLPLPFLYNEINK